MMDAVGWEICDGDTIYLGRWHYVSCFSLRVLDEGVETCVQIVVVYFAFKGERLCLLGEKDGFKIILMELFIRCRQYRGNT